MGELVASMDFFRPYREAPGQDWYRDDPILHAWLTARGEASSRIPILEAMGRDAATRYRELADTTEREDLLPRLADGPGPRTADDVLLPSATVEALGRVHGSGLWRRDVPPAVRYAAVYLLSQNGEWGVMCSVACTDGLHRCLLKLAADDRGRRIVAAIEGATPRRWTHGAQFVTEIQGGSDAGANQVRADPLGDGSYGLHGQKWFCSNLTADHWLVTARPAGAPEGVRGVALFLVPRRIDGKPNGHVVDRLKEKVGTRALATAELTFAGARAWPIGPLDRGLGNMVGLVLTTSRIHNVLGCAAFLRRAVREARGYAAFRTAFGKPLTEHALIAQGLVRLEAAADRTEAGALATVGTWLDAQAPTADDRQRAWARILVSLAKATTARRTPGLVYEAMMVLGGNGIEERFSALPRLWRDSAIFETWEGPYTLLLMQALEDLARFGAGEAWLDLLRRGLGNGLDSDLESEVAGVLSDPDNPASVESWGRVAPKLYEAFEDRALDGLRRLT